MEKEMEVEVEDSQEPRPALDRLFISDFFQDQTFSRYYTIWTPYYFHHINIYSWTYIVLFRK